MLQTLFETFFGCAHRRTTFPLTRGRKAPGAGAIKSAPGRMYVVCLDCGKEFSYDWRSMRIGEPVEVAPAAEAEPVYR